jgi:hypothetical protein
VTLPRIRVLTVRVFIVRVFIVCIRIAPPTPSLNSRNKETAAPFFSFLRDAQEHCRSGGGPC